MDRGALDRPVRALRRRGLHRAVRADRMALGAGVPVYARSPGRIDRRIVRGAQGLPHTYGFLGLPPAEHLAQRVGERLRGGV